jgi:hypothetical protein
MKAKGTIGLHTLHSILANEGLLSPEDYPMLWFTFDGSYLPDMLYVGYYDDRAELRNKGVGKSFYDNLHNISRDMGYRYITGLNNEKNIGFFTKLGRVTLDQIKPEFRDKFRHNPGSKDTTLYTVDFLYNEDKEEYLVK